MKNSNTRPEQQGHQKLWVPDVRWIGPWWLSLIVLLGFVLRLASGEMEGWRYVFGIGCSVVLVLLIAFDLWRRQRRTPTG